MTAAAAILAGALATSAAAQQYVAYPGGVSVVTQDFDPAHPDAGKLTSAMNDPTLLRQVVNTAWAGARASVQDALKAELGRGNLVAKGITLYDIVLTLPANGDLQVKSGSGAGGTLEMRYLLPRAYIEFTSTQPTALGKWADPRVSVTFDVALNIDLDLSAGLTRIQAKKVEGKISNAKADSHGVVADVVFVVNSISKFVGGPNFIATMEGKMNRSIDVTNRFNNGLSALNQLLAKYGSQGYALAESALNQPGAPGAGQLRGMSLPGVSQQSPQLVMVLMRNAQIPKDRPGTISGVIRWEKSLGKPAAGAITPETVSRYSAKVLRPGAAPPKAFRIRAYAQINRGAPGSFTSPETALGVVERMELDPNDSGKDYVLHYTLAQLPLNIPMRLEVQCVPGAPWEGAAAGKQLGCGPDGWSGKVTLTSSSHTGVFSRAAAGAGLKSHAAVELNPQPLPPRSSSKDNPGANAALNPQPLPPRFSSTYRSGAKAALNPQPLPPKATLQLGSTTAKPLGPLSRTVLRPVDRAAVLQTAPKNNPQAPLNLTDINFRVGVFQGPR